MNPIIKSKWLDALRSGKYKQGRGALRRSKTYCCLGVLCDLHCKEKKGRWVKSQTSILREYYLGETSLLPEKVYKWAGLKNNNPIINNYGLADWNDDIGADFGVIAKLIQRKL